jgi:6-phosphogluconolactonase
VSDYIHVLSDLAQGKNAWPVFDIALMGMGEDGHTASLFPGRISPGEDVSPVIQVNASYQDRPAARVTLTPMVFNASRNVIFLIVGEAKARMLQIALSDHLDPENIPVQRIQPAQGNIIWHVDSSAAKLIRERS